MVKKKEIIEPIITEDIVHRLKWEKDRETRFIYEQINNCINKINDMIKVLNTLNTLTKGK